MGGGPAPAPNIWQCQTAPQMSFRLILMSCTCGRNILGDSLKPLLEGAPGVRGFFFLHLICITMRSPNLLPLWLWKASQSCAILCLGSEINLGVAFWVMPKAFGTSCPSSPFSPPGSWVHRWAGTLHGISSQTTAQDASSVGWRNLQKPGSLGLTSSASQDPMILWGISLVLYWFFQTAQNRIGKDLG